MLLDGLHLPLTTPFYSDGRLNVPKLEHNVARYSKTPAAGLVALGDSAESTLLSEEETRRVLRGVVGAAVDEKVLIAGVSRDSVVGTLDLAGWAAEFGYDAVLVRRPSIFRASARGGSAKEMLTYFQTVADRSPLPVILWSGAAEDGALLPVETILELSGHPMILGLVDGSGDFARQERLKVGTAGVKHDVTVTSVFAAVTRRMQTQRGAGELISASTLTDGGAALAVTPTKVVAKTRTKVVGFQILAGRADGMLEALKGGAAGAMPGFAAAAPQACYEVLAAWKDGDEGLAREKQERLADVAKRVEGEMGVAGIKVGCDLNGYFGGWPRLPLLPLTGAERAEIEGLMQGMRH
ncbi:dihydrodipicolinate synthase family protein [Tunturiibacter lichenicola]|uniref:dihydrodipicolinate synthase family protein n=1 Tax=Tunturiibacter lichenicola TaxID=2051959 RepID=UPI0021B25AA9|nr:dihydrodipicolinate synthase family protein [Edaphobacter lichenicola]